MHKNAPGHWAGSVRVFKLKFGGQRGDRKIQRCQKMFRDQGSNPGLRN